MPSQPSPGPSWTTLPVLSSSPKLWGDSDEEEQLISSSQPSSKESGSKKRKVNLSSTDTSPRTRVASVESVKERVGNSIAPSDIIIIDSSSDESHHPPNPRTPTPRNKRVHAGASSQGMKNSTIKPPVGFTERNTSKRIRINPSLASPSVPPLSVQQVTPSKEGKASLNTDRGETERPFKDVPHIDFTKILSTTSVRKKSRRHSHNTSSTSQSLCVRPDLNRKSPKPPAPPVPSSSRLPANSIISPIRQGVSMPHPTARKSSAFIDTSSSPPSPNVSSAAHTFPSTKPTNAVACVEPSGMRARSTNSDNPGSMCSRYPTPAKTLPSDSPVLGKAELLLPVEGPTVSMKPSEKGELILTPTEVDSSGDGAEDGVVGKALALSKLELEPALGRNAGARTVNVAQLTNQIFVCSCAWVGHDINVPYRGNASASPNFLETSSSESVSSSSRASSSPFVSTNAARVKAGPVNNPHLPSPVSPVIPSIAPAVRVPEGWSITSEEILNVKEVIDSFMQDEFSSEPKTPGGEFELMYPPE